MTSVVCNYSSKVPSELMEREPLPEEAKPNWARACVVQLGGECRNEQSNTKIMFSKSWSVYGLFPIPSL